MRKLVLSLASAGLAAVAVTGARAAELSPIERLGRSVFFDPALSLNRNQSCATCHSPEAGWSGPDPLINARGAAYHGSIVARGGNRRPPSAAYAAPSPVFRLAFEEGEALFVGGNFWDGRATGETLGSPAAEQARGPFLNPVEQALPDAACVVYRVCLAPYPVGLTAVWGPESCAVAWPEGVDAVCSREGARVPLSAADRQRVDRTYDQIALSVAAYEASAEVNPYSSKYDLYLAGVVELSDEERAGLELFRNKGKCANCHVLDPGPNGEPSLLTDFTYDNLGVPANPENPWYTMPAAFNPEGGGWVDRGLGAFLETRPEWAGRAAENLGKHKVPTLRNVDRRPAAGFVKAFMHNGYFKTLKGVVHFYNTRDTRPRCPDPRTDEARAIQAGCWPAPEVAANLNTDEMGDLGLTEAEEDALVAFMRTLSDGYQPRGPEGP